MDYRSIKCIRKPKKWIGTGNPNMDEPVALSVQQYMALQTIQIIKYSIILKTFLRPEKLDKCLQSISKLTIKPEKVVIGDDGRPTAEKTKIYEKYKKIMNLEVVELEFDAGISRARNEGFIRTDTDYILLIDDDHYLPSNIYEIKEILDENPEIGGVSPFWEENGEVYCEAGDLKLGKWVIKGIFEKKEPRRTSSGMGFFIYDFIPNSALFRRECLTDYSWDDFFIIGGEHADFYLTHKKMGKWKFAVTPDYIAIHDPKTSNIEYEQNRHSRNKINRSMKYLAKKHNIKGFIYDGCYIPKKQPLMKKLKNFFSKKILPHSLWWYIVRNDIWYNLKKFL